MKKNSKFLMTAVVAVALMFGCKKEETTETTPSNTLDQTEMRLIQAAGFNPGGAIKTEGKYLIEGDILLSSEELTYLTTHNGPELIIAGDEQYRTTKLVTGLPRTIKVRYSGTTASVSTAINAAIARYNAKNLRVHFSRVTSGQHILVSNVSGVSYIASAGFPLSTGNPYTSIKFNTAYAGWAANTLTSVLAHEMGHCIGFRHTDYMSREYSCGGSHVNEGTAGVGAILIPGTPSGPVSGSWMLACIGNGVNRPFNTSDMVALNYVY